MRRFVYGFITAVVVGLLGALAVFLWVRLGFINLRADIPVNPIEKAIAMPSTDASVGRRAPNVKNPVQPTDANLAAGMKIYQRNCASCHGDIDRPHGMFAKALYPRPPQFVDKAPDMPPNQNYFIIQHGIRWTAMPAWEKSLSDRQMWTVTAFLSHMDKLPPQVDTEWKATAGGQR